MNRWKFRHQHINPFTPRVSYGDIKVTKTSESVDEILWCDSNTLPWYYLYFSILKMKFGIRLEF